MRVAEPDGDDWVVNADVQAAILDYFRPRQMEPREVGPFEYHDKIPLKSGYEELGVRVVPPAVARYGSFLSRGRGPDAVVREHRRLGRARTRWSTPGRRSARARRSAPTSTSRAASGSAACSSRRAARPVIVEDGAFIGSRCIVVEGVRIGREAVLAPNVSLTASRADHRRHRARAGRAPRLRPAPRRSSCPGTRPKEFPAGTYHLSCALIIGTARESTDLKTSLNDALREYGIGTG